VKVADVQVVHPPLVFESHTHPGIVSIQFQSRPAANNQPIRTFLGEFTTKNSLKTDTNTLLARTTGAIRAPTTGISYFIK
jgi:hypothetical protein